MGEAVREVNAAKLVEEAKTWIGTPFIHQASVKGVGCDCVGFLAEVALTCEVITPELRAQFPTDYSRQAAGQSLRRQLTGRLVPVPFAARAPGDIVLMRFEVDPQHLAMLTALDPDYIIHCGEKGVVAHRLDSVWRARIVRVYRFPVLTPTCNPPPPPPDH